MVKEVDRIQIIMCTCIQRMVIILATYADEKKKNSQLRYLASFVTSLLNISLY